jgi:flap endonuclease-1
LTHRYTVPEDWPYQEVRTLFKKPNVCTEIPDFQWTSADKEVMLDNSYYMVNVFHNLTVLAFYFQGLVNFLAFENSFSSDRVEKA